MPLEQRKPSPLGKQPDPSPLMEILGGGSSPEEDASKRKSRASSSNSNNSISPTMTRRRVHFDSSVSWDMMEDDDSDDGEKDDELLQHEQSNRSSYYPISIIAALTWFVLTAIVLWCHVLPGATEWWTTTVQQQPPQQEASTSHLATARMMALKDGNARLPGGYRSLEEMQDRPSRFPSIELRTRVYMSNWYQPPCTGAAINSNNNKSSSLFDDTTHIQYNYLRDDSDPKAPPLLALQELKLPLEVLEQELDSNDPTQRKFAHSGNNRTFVLDNTAIVKGARLFYMTADKIRECDKTFCLDFVKFIFPSLHRADMSVIAPADGRQQQQPPFRRTVSTAAAYPGNALDATDGNTNAVVPVLLQFGDLEISRAFVVTSGNNETYPLMPIQKKFRWSMNRDELNRVTSENDPCTWEHRPIPMTRSGSRRLQPIISKLTYQRHFGMLDEIPSNDIPWSEKKDAAIFRGALTGMKRSGFRVVQAALKNKSKLSMCMFMQRCRLVYNSFNSTLVNASLTGTLMYHSHNMIDGPVVPAKLNGVPLYGSRMNYAELLQYKALIMLEGNDISSGFKWALYSNSVVLAQTCLYTSWAMEELLEPWVHYVPLADDLSDVEEKMQWVLDNDEEAQKVAHRGKLWISDLIYHPDAGPDEEAIFDNILRRYKQHFVYNPALSGERLVQID